MHKKAMSLGDADTLTSDGGLLLLPAIAAKVGVINVSSGGRRGASADG
jgi:hypothetical protein